MRHQFKDIRGEPFYETLNNAIRQTEERFANTKGRRILTKKAKIVIEEYIEPVEGFTGEED